MSGEELEEYEDWYVKEGLRNKIKYQLQDKDRETLSGLAFDHPVSDLRKISLGPRNPAMLEIKKWSRNMHTHDLTLIRASGRTQVIKEDKLLELGEYDLKDILLLELEKDPADLEALHFELDMKGQIKDLLVRSFLHQ